MNNWRNVKSCNLNEYVSYFKILYIYFLKFVVLRMNSKMIKFRIVVLTTRENDNFKLDDVVLYRWLLKH
jgi:hypothetical protein